jgi:hypothetical protein
LVGAQVALSVTLLAGAALVITSFIQLSRQNIGFRPENLWIGLVTLPLAQYPDPATRQRFVEKTLATLRAVPTLQSATIATTLLRIISRHGAFRFWLDAISTNTMWPIIKMSF